MKYLKFKKTSAFSLIEMLLVMGVLAVLLIAVFVIYPQVRSASVVKQEIQHLSVLRTGLTTYFESQSQDYSVLGAATETIGTQFANRARLFPVAMNDGNYNTGNIKNGWGGEVIVHRTSNIYGGYAAGRTFAILWKGVPSEVCADMVIKAEPMFSNIQVNGTNVMAREGIVTTSTMLDRCQSSNVVNLTFISK